MTTVPTRYSAIVADVTEDLRQRSCSEQNLGSLARRIVEFEKTLVETSDENSDFGLYFSQHHSLANMVGIYKGTKRYFQRQQPIRAFQYAQQAGI